MKTVNLREILNKEAIAWKRDKEPYLNSMDTDDYVLNAMREACNKAIELAAFTTDNIYDNNGTAYISREIILNTKSQII